MQEIGSVPKALALAAASLALACSGGSGGEGDDNGGGSGLPASFAIEDAAATGAASDLLVGGDMFIGETDTAAAEALGDQMWTALSGVNSWIAANPTYTYQFYVDTDPFTNWGRAFRYTGFSVEVGPIQIPLQSTFYGTGTYIAANGQPHDAIILRTWDSVYWEFLVLESATTFVHAIQNQNGQPIVTTYFAN